MTMPGRTYQASAASKYRYGFNGKENDKDAGEGIQDYGMRIYDSRLGRFLSVDPLSQSYPWYTPYQFAGNKPIWAVDLDGKEEWIGWFIEFLTSGAAKLASITDKTITISITFEAEIGALVTGAATKRSYGLGIDRHGNIAIFGSGVNFWDLFKIAGGVSNNKDLNDAQFVFGESASVEASIGINFNNHISGLAGKSKNLEMGIDVPPYEIGGELAIGFDETGIEIQSLELAGTFGPGTPVGWSLTNSTTSVIGVTAKDLNKMGNVFIEASAIIAVKSLLIKPNGDQSNYSLSTHKTTDEAGKSNLYFQVIETSKDGCKSTIFSKLAITLFSDKETNYERTADVKETEPEK